MIGPLIGITTSIATTAAIGVARCGAAAVTGGAVRFSPVRTRTIVRDSRNSVATLIAALDAEKARRVQLEFEVARLQEMVDVAQETIDELMDERVA